MIARLNAVCTFSLSVLAILTLCCFLSTVFKDKGSPTRVGTTAPVLLSLGRDNTGPDLKEVGKMKLNIEANLSELFDWNTKQLFVMLIAHYTTDHHAVNQIVLWDKIIKEGDSPMLDLHDVNTKYHFIDNGKGLRGNGNLTLQLSWNAIPRAGWLPLIHSDSTRIQLPTQYAQ